jgi:hypothetical protein
MQPQRPRVEYSQERTFVSRELAVSELVARLVLSKSYLSKSQGKLKRAAFDPSPYNELSVVHSTGLPDGDVWEIGKQTLTNHPGRDKIHGRADIPVKSLVERKLRAVRDDNPFQRHTSVVGWPESADSDERKRQRLAICLELSQDPSIKHVIPETPIMRSV